MLEKLYDGNLFLLPSTTREAGVVTTNGVINWRNELVMGAGIAKYCRDNHAGIAAHLGELVLSFGNKAFHAGTYFDENRRIGGLDPSVTVLSMPTKYHWRNPSELGLIRRSCHQLVELANKHGLTAVYLPAPGCGNGGLDYVSQVRPILMSVLDDRFVVCLPSKIALQVPDLKDH